MSSRLFRSAHGPSASPCRGVAGRRPGAAVRTSALPDWAKEFFDFSSWAPKSTRVWRLQQFQYPTTEPDAIDELEAKVNRLASSGSSSGVAASAGPVGVAEPLEGRQAEVALPPTGSFSDAGDDELATALSARIKSISMDEEEKPAEKQAAAAAAAVQADVAAGTPDQVQPLTGAEMRRLILQKYGKTYDCSFVRRDIPGKTFVCLNIMWQHLEQRSFRMTESQYMEKIESIAYLINVLGQTQKVRAFLSAPARSEKGLPRRPVVGTAISIQMDLAPEVIKEFFSSGYY